MGRIKYKEAAGRFIQAGLPARKKFQGRRRRIIKNDRYIRVVLTIIAVCLVWICIKDVRVGGNYLFAKNPGNRGQEVYVARGYLDVTVVNGTPLSHVKTPIPVEVVNYFSFK